MRIRDATDDDVDWLVETVLAACWSVFRPLLPDVDWNLYGDEFYRPRFLKKWPRAQLCEIDNLRAGFTLTINAHIEMFFVAEGARSKGVGAVLMRNAEAHGARTLECIAENHAARRFYERLGWALTKEYNRPYGGQTCAFVRYERPETAG